MTTIDERPTDSSNGTLAVPDERGDLKVSLSVLRKLAQRAADHTPGTLRAPRRIAGERGSSARVDGEGGTVAIALDVALCYPASVRKVTDQVRRRVSDEIEYLTGYQVRAVRVTVSALLRETGPRVR